MSTVPSESRRRRVAYRAIQATVIAFCSLVALAWIVNVFIQTQNARSGMLTTSKLKQLGMAMHSYNDGTGSFPGPNALYTDEKGQISKYPVSWRVLLLPYIDQQALYDEFRLDEPWDSPHNLALLPRMPSTYAAPGSKARKMPAYHTVCHVFVGEGTAFEGRGGLLWSADFPNGLANTILVVEAGPPVPWTKPEELPYAADRPLPDLRLIFKEGFRVAACDGHVQLIGTDADERILRRAIVRNQGGGLEELERNR